MFEGKKPTAAQLLKESEERLFLVLDSVGDGSWDWNIPTGETYYSDRWLKSLGYERRDVTPHVSFWESLIHPDDADGVWATLSPHLEGKTDHIHIEHRLRFASGEYRWTLGRGRVVARDSEGAAIRMVGTNCDITEQYMGALLLREPGRRYQLLFESAGSPILCLDENRCVTEFNGAAERLFGWRREEILGKHFSNSLLPEDRRERVNEFIAKIERGEAAGEFKGRVLTRAGNPREIVWTATPIRDSEGRLLGIVAVGQDVSDLRADGDRLEEPTRIH